MSLLSRLLSQLVFFPLFSYFLLLTCSNFSFLQLTIEMNKQADSDVRAFLCRARSIGMWSTACGRLFERRAHCILSANIPGQAFTCQKLVLQAIGSRYKRIRSGNTELIPIHCDTRQSVDDLRGFAHLEDKQYGYPTNKSLCTVDSSLGSSIYFQMTIAESHHIDIDVLLYLHRRSKKKKISLFFVLPQDSFYTFKIGAFRRSKKTSSVAKLLDKVQFWALLLEGPPSYPPAPLLSAPLSVASSSSSSGVAAGSSSASVDSASVDMRALSVNGSSDEYEEEKYEEADDPNDLSYAYSDQEDDEEEAL